MPRYSSHARKRMLKRGITVKDVEETISRPLEIRDMRYGGRKAAYRHLSSCSYLVVIYESDALLP